MKVIHKITLLPLLTSMLICCKDKTEEPIDDSAIRYEYFRLENNGWKSKKNTQKINDIVFTATEVPLPYYILKESGSEDLFYADSIYQQNKRERIIEFEYSHQEEKDLLEKEFTSMNYQESVKYMSFSLEKDFYVVTSKQDTIACSGLTFERNFKIAPYHKVLLFFTNIDPDDEIQLIYQDKLFKKGTLKFKFQEKITKLLL
ncbi:hypothetical protein [uncultured Chryseobacterium sp.]|uniref:hypothetical protein n=1 Tax=uncultured Chryseobacterium sp. TaxID=259322 RepID=UPI002584D66E|nr:hypothetical protein [uncultured Chryseobacterium sp.]